MQTLLYTLHKGGLDGQLGGSAPLSLQDGSDDARYLLQVFSPHQVGHLSAVQDVVDILRKTELALSCIHTKKCIT